MTRFGKYSRYWPLFLFFAISCLSLLSMLLSRGSLVHNYFHPDPTDSAMDFFNCLAVAPSDAPYEHGSNYPPMCYLLLKALHLIIPAGEPSPEQLASAGSASVGHYLRSFQNAYLIFVFSLVGCTLLIALCTIRMASTHRERDRYLLTGAVCISGPYLFLLERGNILLFALAGTFVFLTSLDSESYAFRIAGLISLAFSASLKIYPFIFSILLLRERRFRAFAITSVMTLCMFVIPFLLFGGMSAVSGFLTGLTKFVSEHSSLGLGLKYSADNMVDVFEAVSGVAFPSWLSAALPVVILVMGGCSIVFDRNSMHALAFAGLLCTVIPTTSYTYAVTFLLPAFVRATVDGITSQRSALDNLISLCLVMSLSTYSLPPVPLQENTFADVKYPLTWGCLIGNIAQALMLVLLSVPVLAGLGKRILTAPRFWFLTRGRWRRRLGSSGIPGGGPTPLFATPPIGHPIQRAIVPNNGRRRCPDSQMPRS